MSNTARGVRSPEGRYDVRRSGSRTGTVLLAVVCGVALLLGTYRLYDRFGASDVTHQLQAYRVVSDAEVVVTVAVSARVRAVCTIAARSADGADVGSTQVDVPQGRRTVEVRVPTRARATTGVVQRCAPAP